jgi:hypothetical protein
VSIALTVRAVRYGAAWCEELGADLSPSAAVKQYFQYDDIAAS